jgi:predicted PurR-regulated permease PerM
VSEHLLDPETADSLAPPELQTPTPGWSLARATRGVPVATIVTTVAIVLSTWGVLWLLSHTTKIITWVLISAFFAIVLTPPVDLLVKRLHFRRAIATSLVFVVGLAAIGLLGYLFIKPLAEQGTSFAKNFSTYVADAEAGKGTAGKLVKRYKLDDWLEKNQDELQKRAQNFFEPKQVLGVAVGTVGTVFSSVAAVLTVAVLTFLMLLEGHGLLLSATRVLHPPAQERARRVGRQCARAVTGYVNGNLLISVIAGLATWIFLLIANVPFAGVLALWVGFADLIPLVGATLGAIPTIAVAFLYSTPVGVATLIFYVVYQQIENQVLQPTIMARTVALQPLVVLLSVLFGVELFGLLGALLAIPVAGIIKVVASDLLAHHRPDLVELERRTKRRRALRRKTEKAVKS